MQRRDFVKGIAMASVAATSALGQQAATPPQGPHQPPSQPPAPPPQAAVTGGKAPTIPATVPDVVANTQAHFFSEQQLAALRKLSAVLVPASGSYPGAVEVGVPEFLDFLIGVAPVERQHMYQSGLDRLNEEARRQFGKPFAGTSAEQADALIRPGLTVWFVDHPPKEPFKRFITLAHRDIRTATMNSQAWSAAVVAAGERAPSEGLYWSPIDPT